MSEFNYSGPSILRPIFINDLTTGIKDMNVGVPIGDEKISILLYADDIVLLAENEDRS